MSKLLLAVAFLAISSVAWAGRCEFPTGSIFEVTPIEGEVDVSSSSVYSTYVATTTGIQRFYQNCGNGSIFYKWGGSTNITTTGFELLPKGVYIEDRYFGTIYFKSSTTTNDMRYKILVK